MMLRTLCIFSMLILLVGCGAQIPKFDTLIPGVDIVVVDERPEHEDYDIGYESLLLGVCPLVPYATQHRSNFLDHSFVPEFNKMVENSKVFTFVADAQTPTDMRIKAPWEMQVHLKYSTDTEIQTSYMLGFATFPLYLVGFPILYAKTTVEIDVKCIRRKDGKTYKGVGNNTDISPWWFYGPKEYDASTRTKEVLNKAFIQAFAQCLHKIKQTDVVSQ